MGAMEDKAVERVAIVTTEVLMRDPEKGQLVARRVVELALNTMKAETHLGALAELALKALTEWK